MSVNKKYLDLDPGNYSATYLIHITIILGTCAFVYDGSKKIYMQLYWSKLPSEAIQTYFTTAPLSNSGTLFGSMDEMEAQVVVDLQENSFLVDQFKSSCSTNLEGQPKE